MTEPQDPAATPRHERGFDVAARLSYNSYLKVPELLRLQECQSRPAHHDELQFIIVHQTYELWFRLILFEVAAVREALFGGRLHDAEDGLRRITEIEKVLVGQIHVLETMSPAGFLGFRDHLRPASGFQSAQFRELEVVSGLREKAFLEFLIQEGGSEVQEAVERRLAEPSLRDALHAALRAAGLDAGWDAGANRCDEAKVAAVLAPFYRERTPRDLYTVVELLALHDELVMLWRHHHVCMVERLIGNRTGTGGSSGAQYLKSTTQRRFFPELLSGRGALSPSY